MTCINGIISSIRSRRIRTDKDYVDAMLHCATCCADRERIMEIEDRMKEASRRYGNTIKTRSSPQDDSKIQREDD